MSIQSGNSFRSARITELGVAPYTVWGVPFDVLDLDVASLDKQIRVAVNDTEYLWDDPDLPTAPENRWSWEAGKPAGDGVACWGIRFSGLRSIDSFPINQPQTGGFTLWDGDGEVIETDATFATDGRENLWDGDPTTAAGWSLSSNFESDTVFTRQLSISKIGWTRDPDDPGNDSIERIRIELNTGTPSAPRWTEIYFRDDITVSDYPTISDPFDPETDTFQVEVPESLTGGTLSPVITLTPAPESLNDRVTIWRETRQDRSWVRPTGAGRALGSVLWTFFQQQLFIYQELCALSELAVLLGLPPADTFQNDWSGGDILSPSSTGDIDFSGIELLEGIPGAPSDPGQQLVVDRLSSGVWEEISPTAYTIDAAAKTITPDDSGTHRARRVTRKDRFWVNIDTTGPFGWGTAVISLIQQQLRFLREEACIPPSLYDGHLLNTTIFPRSWNYLVFETGGTDFTFGGPSWGPDGTVVVYENDVELTEGTDYTVNFPQVTIPGGTNNPVTIGGGGGGFGYPNLPGSDEDSSDDPVVPETGNPETPEWPGLDLSVPFSITIGATKFTEVRDGNWEGEESWTQSVFSDTMLIRVFITATEAFGFYQPNDQSVAYFARSKCGNGSKAFLHAYAFRDAGGSGEWTNVVAVDGAPGACTVRPNGAFSPGGGQMFLDAMAQVSSQTANPLLQFALGLNNVPAQEPGSDLGDLSGVPFYDAWSQLAEQSVNAQENGVVSEIGFTGEQFENYIDPDVDFDDFDIPIP